MPVYPDNDIIMDLSTCTGEDKELWRVSFSSVHMKLNNYHTPVDSLNGSSVDSFKGFGLWFFMCICYKFFRDLPPWEPLS